MRVEERAVIDRITDGQHAVLMVGDNQRQVNVPAVSLPEGAIEGTWLLVQFDGDELVIAEIDQTETERVRARITTKMEVLRERGRNTS